MLPQPAGCCCAAAFRSRDTDEGLAPLDAAAGGVLPPAPVVEPCCCCCCCCPAPAAVAAAVAGAGPGAGAGAVAGAGAGGGAGAGNLVSIMLSVKLLNALSTLMDSFAEVSKKGRP